MFSSSLQKARKRKRPSEVGKRDQEIENESIVLEQDRKRHLGKSNNLDEMVAQAALSIDAQQHLPAQFGLCRLTTAYSKEKMAETLATLDERSHTQPGPFDKAGAEKDYTLLWTRVEISVGAQKSGRSSTASRGGRSKASQLQERNQSWDSVGMARRR